MANELVIHYPPGSTLYAQRFDATGNIWNGSAHVEPNSANWLDYDIAMSEIAGTGIYRASMPAAAAGVYGWVVRKQAGVNPAVGDVTVGTGRIEWSGTAEVALTSRAVPTDIVSAGAITTLTGAVVQTNSVTGTISADVVSLNGDTDPVDNLVLALGTGGLVEKLNSMLEAAGLDYRFTAEALAEAPSDSGLTAQQMRDALKLAPTAGTPADGSIDKHVDDLLIDTAAIRLITDAIDVSAVTVITSNNAGELTIQRTATFAATVSGLVIPADWTAVLWTLKGAASDDDDDAVLQVRVSNPAAVLTDGLQRIEGSAPSGSLTIASGSCTVSQAGGTVALALKAAATAALTVRGDAAWDLRVLRPTNVVEELTTGTADIVYTVTHAGT